MNDTRDTMSLAERLAPTVQVPGTTGQYKIFNDLNSFQVYNTRRAMGGDPTRIKFEASDGSFNCKPNALEITVDQEERRQVGEDNAIGQQLLDQGKVKALINVNGLSRLKTIVDAVLAGVAAEGGDVGKWSDPGIDPIDQLDEQLDILSKRVGSADNIKLDMDLTSWRTIRNHKLVKARCNGVQVGGISREQLVAMLAIPVDFKVSSIVYNQKALGQAQDKKRILAGTCLLHYSVASPTQYDPSAFKTLTCGQAGSSVTAVRSWQSPNGLFDAHFIDWSEQIVQTSSQAILRVDLK